MLHGKGGGSREGRGTFISYTNYQGIENSVEQGRVVITLNIIKHHISFLVCLFATPKIVFLNI
jgi:hypothetical protein